MYSLQQAADQARWWLSRLCTEHCHGASESASDGAGPAFLIDVWEARITHAAQSCSEPYLALSYVYGGYSGGLLTLDIVTELTKPGSLRRVKLPKTFMDAMRFTGLVGLRYLWIDAMCILDGDQGADVDQINRMNRIYGNAYLVLIAVLGDSPDSGLHLRSIPPAKINGRHLCIAGGSSAHTNEVVASVYSTRAWCFQEGVLTTRRMYFCSNWILLQCDHAPTRLEYNLKEDKSLCDYAENQATDLIHKSPRQLSTRCFDELYRAYDEIVQDYTKRLLRYGWDEERAFAGIADQLERAMNSPVYHCIPAGFMPDALLWGPVGRKNYRCLQGNVVFPSWSWSSSDGMLDLNLKRYPFPGQRDPLTVRCSFGGEPRTRENNGMQWDEGMCLGSPDQRSPTAARLSLYGLSATSMALELEGQCCQPPGGKSGTSRLTVLHLEARAIATTTFSFPLDFTGFISTPERFARPLKACRPNVGLAWGILADCEAVLPYGSPSADSFRLDDSCLFVALLRGYDHQYNADDLGLVLRGRNNEYERIGVRSVDAAAFEAAEPSTRHIRIV